MLTRILEIRGLPPCNGGMGDLLWDTMLHHGPLARVQYTRRTAYVEFRKMIDARRAIDKICRQDEGMLLGGKVEIRMVMAVMADDEQEDFESASGDARGAVDYSRIG